MGRIPYIRGSGDILIGDNVNLSYHPTFAVDSPVYDNPQIIIEDNSFIGSMTAIFASQLVKIGNNRLIAANVRIYD